MVSGSHWNPGDADVDCFTFGKPVWAARTRPPATTNEATVLDPSACIYEDECGIAGARAHRRNGCEPLPEGACDCDGNTIDALNVCGGTC